jgi:hypothetical protein
VPDALEFCDLLARLAPDRSERAAPRWHGGWEMETKPASIAEAQLALTCLPLLIGDHRSERTPPSGERVDAGRWPRRFSHGVLWPRGSC